jgi:hypothetical protein
MGKRVCLYILLLFCSPLTLFAEARLVFGNFVLTEDTVHHNDIVSLTTTLHNAGNQSYHGSLSFGFSINSTRNVSTVIFNAPYNGESISINPGDSLPLLFHVLVQSQYFLAGPDIFVVWPIIDNNRTPDTIEAQIWVLDQISDVATETPDNALRVYTSNNLLFIENADHLNLVQQAKVFDVSGRLLVDVPVSGLAQIPFPSQPAGVYVVQLCLTNGQRRSYKIAMLRD